MTCWELTLGPTMNRCVASLRGRGLHACSQCKAFPSACYCTAHSKSNRWWHASLFMMFSDVWCRSKRLTDSRPKSFTLTSIQAQALRSMPASSKSPKRIRFARIMLGAFAKRPFVLMHLLASSPIVFAALFKLLHRFPHMHSTTGMQFSLHNVITDHYR